METTLCDRFPNTLLLAPISSRLLTALLYSIRVRAYTIVGVDSLRQQILDVLLMGWDHTSEIRTAKLELPHRQPPAHRAWLLRVFRLWQHGARASRCVGVGRCPEVGPGRAARNQFLELYTEQGFISLIWNLLAFYLYSSI
eukprot:6206492-Pleurochrysis_carterae.AAC.2